jgi:RES domain-containing protein
MASRRSGPVRAYRIADRRHPLFDGMGAFLNGGRWTSKGGRVIHAAETYAGALLEMLVHTNLRRIPRTHCWIEIEAPETLVEEVHAESVPEWTAPGFVTSRAFGDLWYKERRSAVLLAPSMVTNGVEHSVLINQEHPDFGRIGVSEPRAVVWDARLFGG